MTSLPAKLAQNIFQESGIAQKSLLMMIGTLQFYTAEIEPSLMEPNLLPRCSFP